MSLFSRKPNVRRLRRRGDLEGLRRALRYRETMVDDDGEWDLGVQIRADAAAALSEFEGPEVAEDLAEALVDPQPGVRLAAVDAIGEVDMPIAAEALAGCVAARDDGAEEVSDRALALLEGWGVEGPAELVVEKLFEAQAPELDDRHREAIERLLAVDPSGAETRAAIADRIVATLQEPTDPGTEERGERILGWLGGSVADVVLEALADGRAAPAVVRAAGLLGDARAVEPIVRGLGSTDPEIRRSAAVAAGTLNHTRAVLGLLAASQDPEQRVRDAASEALNRMGTAAVITAMATFMQLGMEDQLLSGGQVLPDTQFLPQSRDALAPGAHERPRAPAQPPPPTVRRRSGGIIDRLFGRID